MSFKPIWIGWGAIRLRWYEALDDRTRARIAVTLDRLSLGSCPAKSVGAGVLELRMDFGPGHRVYLGREGDCS